MPSTMSSITKINPTNKVNPVKRRAKNDLSIDDP